MTALAKYDAACKALAAASSVDEVMKIRSQAGMMKAAARIAKNRDLEIQAIELRMRGERKLGELIGGQKKTHGLHKGGRPKTRSREEQVSETATLKEAGIDRKLSMHAQKMAAVPSREFEKMVKTWKHEAAVIGARMHSDLLKVGAVDKQRETRRAVAQALSDTSAKLAGQRKVPCIYADPAWARKAGIGGRAYENHYETMDWHAIMALPIADLMLDDGWLFLWLPRAHLLSLIKVKQPVQIADGSWHDVEIATPLAWAIAKAWGCDSYSTLAVWTKTDDEYPDDHGTGLIFYDQDEILCLFKRGNGLPMPETTVKFGSNHRERSKPLGHSRKPQFYRDMIAAMTGGLPVLELNYRYDPEFPLPPNWEAWGNEAEPPPAPQPVDADPILLEADGLEYRTLSQIADGQTVDGNLIEKLGLRVSKFITGKKAMKLTRTGTNRLNALEEHFARRAMLKLLPTDIDQLVARYEQGLVDLHQLALDGDDAGAAKQIEALELMEERANGDTHFGMACDDSPAERLRLETSAPVGEIPTWGRRGVFKMMVDDVPYIVEQNEHGNLSVYAVDASKPFISETGFRSFMGDIAFGCTVDQQAEAYIRESMASESGSDGKKKPRKSMPMPSTVYRLPDNYDGGFHPIEVERAAA